MKNLFKIQALLAIFLVGGTAKVRAEVYSQKNPMPKLQTSAALDGISDQLYTLLRESGSQQRGIDALLDPKIWELWVEGGVNFITTQKAITDKALIPFRDKALEQIAIIAKIFASAAKSKKGTSSALKKAMTANAQLQGLTGASSSIIAPCKVPGASDCSDPNFQEQWSLLKVFGFSFNTFVRTMAPLFEDSADSNSFEKLKSAMITQNTALFLSGLKINVSDFGGYPVIARYADDISNNIFLAVPRIPTNSETAFIKYLEKATKFIGDSNKQRAQDMKLIVQYWKEVMDRLQKSFKELHKLQKQNVPGEKIEPNTINIKLLPWDKPLAKNISPNFSWIAASLPKISAIIDRSNVDKKKCSLDACRQRYDLLILLSSYLEQLIKNIDRSLTNLKAMKA